jgi:hypothetical protein
MELMEKLNPKDATFVELKMGNYPWWDNLKKNNDISIQIRKGNTIDVYYNGGAILRELKFDTTKRSFTASIHPKYIPLHDESNYQFLKLDSDGVKFTGNIDRLALSQLGNTELKAITNRIKRYFGTESEKSIQYNFAVNDSYIIDTEFQMGREKLRIDLIRLDKSVKKIVFIEVKTMRDPRLFLPSLPKKENVQDQLKKYMEFAVKHRNDILAYYSKVLRIKNDLGITKPELKKLTLDEWEVKEKPLLLFGDCEESWIKGKAAEINKKIKDVACGAYYFCDTTCNLDLIPKTKEYRYIF